MPNRIIKESICYSDDIDSLSSFAETVFYRLLVRVDDYGRIDARPGFLRSLLFTTKNGVSEKNVSEAVAQMASLGLVKLYEVEGKPFLELTNWWKHQPKYGRKTGEYKKWRMDVFLRDKFTCRVCGKVGGKLNAHHIKRYAQEPSLRTDLRNGITLCEDCHKEIHRKEGK